MASNGTGRVIVGISNSIAGYEALRYAVGQARQRGATLIAVRAFRYSYCGGTRQFEGIIQEAAQADVTTACPVIVVPMPEMAGAGSPSRLARQAADEAQQCDRQG